MTNEMQSAGGGGWTPWRTIGWGTAALLLLVPLVANAPWTVGDFIFAGLMLGFVGLVLELTVKVTRSWTHRAAVASAIAAAFLIVWANGAVGMIGSEENPYNLFFFGVIVVALLGSVVVRFRPARMAVAMLVAALVQVAVAVGGMPTDVRGGILSALFAALWLLSAALFRQAAREQAVHGAAT